MIYYAMNRQDRAETFSYFLFFCLVAAMVEAAKAMQACVSSLGASNDHLHQCLMEWTDAEQNCSKLSGEVYGSVNQNILSNSTRCGTSAAAYSNFVQKYVSIIFVNV